MKQTNNAIKFLMAQYRSIFKNAYFKGLTTAMVVTAGLAAAQGAQAAAVANAATAVNTSGALTVIDSAQTSAPNDYKCLQATEGNVNPPWVADVTIKTGTPDLNGNYLSTSANSATITGTGSLTIDGSTNNAGFFVGTNVDGKTVDLTLKSINVKRGVLNIQDGNGSSKSGSATVKANINIGSQGTVNLISALNETATLGTTNHTITIESGGKLVLNMTGTGTAEIAGTLAGEGILDFQGSGGTIKAVTGEEGSDLNIKVAKGANAVLALSTADVAAGKVFQTDGKIELGDKDGSGSFTISGSTLRLGDDSSVVASTGSKFVFNGAVAATVLEGKLTDNVDLHFSGSAVGSGGTIKAYTGEGGINTTITVDNKNEAVLNLQNQNGDTFAIASGSVNLGVNSTNSSKLTINNGTLALAENDNAKLTVTYAAAADTGKGIITLNANAPTSATAEDAVLKLSSTQLKNFLNDTNKGSINLTKGTIYLTDSSEELFDVKTLDGYFTSTLNSQKAIAVSDGSILRKDNLLIKDKINNASGLIFQADDTITLGDKDFKSDSGDLGIKEARAKNVVYKAESGASAFTLQDDLTLAAVTPAEDNYSFDTADSGSISGNVIVKNATKTIAAGNYTNSNTMTLNGGTLQVGGNDSGVDASLVQTGAFTLDGGNVVVAGNGFQEVPIEDSEDGSTATYDSVVSLDLTGAALALKGANNNFAVSDATVYVNGTQAQQILGQDTKTPTGSALVTLGKDGVLDVAGEIKGYNSTFIEVGAIGSKGKNIQFADKSATLRADEIWLKASKNNGKSVDNLVLGSGTINTDVLTVTTLTKSVSDNITYLPFNVSGGTLEIGQRLDFFGSINNDDGAFVLNDTDLNLGWRKVAADDSVTTSAAEGSVQQSLQLTNKSSLSVNYGSWRIGNVSLSGSSLSIGADSEKDKTLDYAVGVQGKALTLGTGSSAVVHENGTATFDSIELNKISSGVGNSLTVNKGGNLTTTTIALDKGNTRVNNSVYVEGQMTVVGDESDSHGIKFEEGSYIRVKGSDAKLTFDSDAVQNITVSGDTVSAGAFIKNFEIIDNGTLALNFNGETHFTEAAIKELRKALFIGSDGQYLAGRRIDLGAAILDGVTPTDGFLSWNDYQNGNKNGFQDIISDIQTDTLRNTTLTDVDANDVINLSVGNIKADADVAQVKLGSVTLSNASANDNSGNNFIFAADDPSKAIGAIITSDSAAVLENGGNIGAVTLEAGSDGKTTKFSVVSEDAATTIKGDLTAGANSLIDIKGVTNVEGNVSGDALTVDKALTANNITLSGALLSTSDINVGEGDIKVGGNLTSPLNSDVAGDEEIATDEDGNFISAGKLTAKNLTVDGNMLYVGDVAVAGTTTLNGTSHGFVNGNNTFGDLVLNRRLFVGSQAGKDASAYKTTVNGTLTINNPVNGAGESDLDIEGAILSAGLIQGKKLDEAGNLTAAPFFVEVGTDAPADDGDYNASTGYLMADRVDLQGGTIRVDPTYSMPASIVTVNTFGDKAIALDGKDAGTLDGNLVTLQNSILAVGLERTKGEQDGIAQVKALFKDYFAENGALNYAADKDDSIGSILYVAKALNVKEGSKLVVDATRSHHTFNSDSFTDHEIYLGDKSALAINASAGQQEGKAAINFAESGASIYSDGGKIVVVVDDSFNPNSQEIQLFADGDTEEGTKGVDIASDSKTIRVETLNGLFIQEFTYDADAEDPNANAISSVKLEYTPEAETKAFANASDPVSKTLSTYAQMTLPDGATGNALLNRVRAGNDTTAGRDAEVVARLGAFGGAAQAAIAAGSTTYEAVSGRMGVGATGANITVADNTQGAALWLTPVYKNRDSDGFGADGVEYGADLDLYGVALGADYTLANGFKVGAAFNIGSGDADGNGAGEGVSNDFDYYGFAIYGGYTYGPYSVVADISYTNVDNEVDASTSVDGVGKVGTSFDSSNLSVGVTAQYQALLDGDVTVTPHAGLRYTKIDLDDYTVHGENGDVAAYSSDNMSIFSIPFGVTVAKEFVNGTWTVKPSFDLTLTANMGDDSADGSVNWGVTGLENTAVASEVLDNFTYGATVGVAAKSGNFSLGFGLNYTGSSNTDEFGVNANARFVF